MDNNAVDGQLSFKGSHIPKARLTGYNLVDCLHPDALIWKMDNLSEYAEVMRDFISKKCKEDDEFLMDLLDFLGSKGSEFIGRSSLCEHGTWVLPSACWKEIFFSFYLLREINNERLRPKLLSIINFGSKMRAILARRLFGAMRPEAGLAIPTDMTQYQIPVLKYLSSFLEEDINYWKYNFKLIPSKIGASTYSDHKEIEYVGYYLSDVVEIYKKSCEDANGQLFISREHIGSIRELLERILKICNSSYNITRGNSTGDKSWLLSLKINDLLEETQDMQWPENPPKDYHPTDIKWPEYAKDQSEKDEGRAPIKDQSGEEKTKEQNVSNQGNSKLPQIAIGIIVALIIAYLLFGRRFKYSNLDSELMSCVSTDLLKGQVQSRSI